MQGKQLTMLLGVLYGGAFLAGFNENLMNMGLIAIMDEFAIGSVTAQWLVTAFRSPRRLWLCAWRFSIGALSFERYSLPRAPLLWSARF